MRLQPRITVLIQRPSQIGRHFILLRIRKVDSPKYQFSIHNVSFGPIIQKYHFIVIISNIFIDNILKYTYIAIFEVSMLVTAFVIDQPYFQTIEQFDL